ncbi:hypothetical protein CSC67_08695 [Pusillimonas caeni]|uniref:phage tail assembly chaperone n=1 Tax=Pusillimonas caeni TaxID=1348472 RepID=UPI000E59FA92|nr:hypothetical protein [Pusillimonas caeni]TFL14220.1 hypothetical protein CSC67_08695 [Pusillimonas caeni]
MVKPVEVTVNETVFFITPMDAFEALAVFGDLQKDILPAVGDLIAAVAKEEGDKAGDEAAMARAIQKLSEKLDGKQLTRWADRLLTKDSITVEINGADLPLDAAAKAMAFREFTDVLELLFHVIKVNFAGPLARWLSRTGLGLNQLQAGLSDAIGRK